MILALPVLVSAQSTTDTIARIQELVRQLTVVQQQLKDLLAAQSAQTSQPVSGVALSPPFRVCPAISRVLSRGTRGDDVLELQKFLISQRFLDEENASGFFGSLTEDALRKWQSANGIVSSGDALSTGWGVFGPATRAHIVQSCGRNDMTPVTPSTSFIPLPPNRPEISLPPMRPVYPDTDVSISAVSGPTTLSVGERGIWNIHTLAPVGSKLSYSVIWGDEVQAIDMLNALAGIATQNTTGTFTHTYTRPGRYSPRFTVWTDSASASASISVIVGDGGTSKALSARPTSGAAPLTVTFVTPDMCVRGLAMESIYRIDFGDGSAPEVFSECGTRSTVHSYRAAGTYLAQFQESGFSNVAPEWRTRANVRIDVNRVEQPSAVFSASPLTGWAPLAVTFAVSADIIGPRTTSGGGLIANPDAGSYKIVFGDGSEEGIQCAGGQDGRCTVPIHVRHVYERAGTYVAQLVHYGYYGIAGNNSRVVASQAISVGGQHVDNAILQTIRNALEVENQYRRTRLETVDMIRRDARCAAVVDRFGKDIEASARAVALLEALIANFRPSTSLSAEREALEKLDTYLAQKIVHTQKDLQNARDALMLAKNGTLCGGTVSSESASQLASALAALESALNSLIRKLRNE
jgi:PKD repeat protein